ncbi:TRAP transporter small permease [Roseomonas sp. M0104]|uniref:TRAP transporter small permease protein n=1 Tax=Teichococcus coralli TaxID=2545983 RepID=A0A845BEF2_9PROT|nr:TRAP transporter small permease [Pseudoroseomonas coralli]MXP65325.1 TRAP transporter small permease [Pseudoroseomonas coralli]
MQTFLTIDRRLGFVLRFLASAALALLMLLVGANVVARAVGLPEIAWVGEGVEFLFAWMVFLGAAELWREGGHFAVDVLLNALPAGLPRRLLRGVVTLCCLAFALILCWYGTSLALDASATSPILELPVTAWYAAIPVGAALMAMASLRDLACLLLALPQGARSPATSLQETVPPC